MATWVRNGTGTLPSATGGTVGGSVSLNNATAPADFDPAGVTDVRCQWSIQGSGFGDDRWSFRNGFQLDSGGVTLAQSFTTAIGNLANTTQSGDRTSSAPNTGRSTAEWEAAVVLGDIADEWATYIQNMSPDGGTVAMTTLTITITYTPGGTTFQESVGGALSFAGALTARRIPPAFQRLVPVSDLRNDGWSTAPLWSKLDDNPLAGTDGDSISETGLSGSIFHVGLSAGTDPRTPWGHRILIECSAPSGSFPLLSVRLRNGSDDSQINGATAAIAGVETRKLRVIELTPAQVATIIDYSDLYIEVETGSTDTFTVWNVSFEIPVAAPEGPTWDAVTLPPGGNAGPVVFDGFTYAIAFPNDTEAWIMRAAAPTDGHNPGEWEPVRLAALSHQLNLDDAAAPSWESVYTNSPRARVEAAAIFTDGTRLYTVVRGHNVSTVSTREGVYFLTAWVHDVSDDLEWDSPAAGMPQTTGLSTTDSDPHYRSLFAHAHTSIDDVQAIIPEPDSGTAKNLLAVRGDLDAAPTTPTVTVSAEGVAMSAPGLSGRTHVVYSNDTDAGTGPARQRTVRANQTLQTAPGSNFDADTITFRGHGAVGSGGLVAIPLPKSGEIDAAVFTSADSPTPSVETVETVALDLTADQIAVGVGVGAVVWLLYIDSTGAVRANSRGASAWGTASEVIADTVDWKRLHAALVAASTIGVLVAESGGVPSYFEIDAATGTTFTQSIAGALTPAGAVDRFPMKVTAGAVSPAGQLVRDTSRTTGGSISPAGSLLRRTARQLGGTITSSGAFLARIVITLALAGTLTLDGALRRTTRTPRSGDVTPAGAVRQLPSIGVEGSVTAAGTLTRLVSTTRVGAVTLAGALRRTSQTIRAGNLTLAGALTRTTSAAIDGNVTLAGQLTRRTARALGGAIGPAGQLTRQARITLGGAIALAGALTTELIVGTFTLAVGGTLALSGVLNRSTARTTTGTLAPDGAVTRATARTLTGSVSPGGSLARRTGTALSGALTLAGDLTADLISGLIQLAVGGTLTLAGAVTRQTRTTVAGTVALAGALTRRTSTFLSGVLTSAGTLATELIVGLFTIALSGSLALSGQLRRSTLHQLAGQLTPAGTVARRIERALAGTLDLVGDLSRRTILSMAGTVASSGEISTFPRIRKGGQIAPVGTRRSVVRVALGGTLSTVGTMTKAYAIALGGQLTMAGVVATYQFRIIAGAVGRYIRTQTGRVGRIRQQGRGAGRILGQSEKE